MTDRKCFYLALTLTPKEKRERTQADMTVLAAEVGEEHRAEEILEALGLVVDPETDRCPPPAKDN